jgi:hypothetical protein
MEPIVSDDELVDLVSAWYGQGLVTDTNLARLKDRYLLDLGATTCTSCPNWKQDMLTHFRLYLRSIGRTLMATTTNKYQIKADIGSFHSAAHGTIFTNANVASPGVTPISDDIIAELKKLDEGYAEYFEANPDYVAPEAKKKDEDKK